MLLKVHTGLIISLATAYMAQGLSMGKGDNYFLF